MLLVITFACSTSIARADYNLSKWESLINKCLAMQDDMANVTKKELQFYDADKLAVQAFGSYNVKKYPKFDVYYSYETCQIVWPNGDYITKVIDGYLINKSYADGSGLHNVLVTSGEIASLSNNDSSEDLLEGFPTVLVPYKSPANNYSWISNSNGTWAKGAILILDQQLSDLDIIEQIFKSNTMPKLMLTTEIEILQGEKVIKKLNPKYVSVYNADAPDSRQQELDDKNKEAEAKRKEEQNQKESFARVAGTWTNTESASDGSWKITRTLIAYSDGTCSLKAIYHGKVVRIAPLTGKRITYIYDLKMETARKNGSFSIRQGANGKEGFYFENGYYDGTYSGTVVINGVQKKQLSRGDIYFTKPQFLMASPFDNIFVLAANGTQLKSNGHRFKNSTAPNCTFRKAGPAK